MSFSSGLRTVGNFFLWGVIPLLIGWLLALQIAPQPAVGLIRINTDIWTGSAELILEETKQAREDPSIKAVVVQINSPGGEVVASQMLYMELQRLRREMPVVGSIDDIAASGGYYAALGADPIYAKPSSTVGNVGVWSFAPQEVGVNDVIIASGPFKLTASNRDEFLREIEGIKQEFLATVTSQRGERLQISSANLSQGLAYSGREALRLGLIDYLGSRSEAIAAAAAQAGIVNYEVIDLEPRAFEALYGQDDSGMGPWEGMVDPVTGQRILPPVPYLLYDPHLGGRP